MKSSSVDMTSGPLFSSLVFYSVPIIAGSLIQVLFNMADQVVLGQMAGTTAVASVGACTVICNLIINLFCGLSGGVNVVLARFVGNKDSAMTRRTVQNAMLLSVLLGILAISSSIPLADWFLRLTRCPASCMDGAKTYLTIYFLSMPAMLVYNFGGTVIRVSGDSRRPLYYLIAAGLLNVVLNILLCLVLEQKVAAVAIATFATQVLGAILVVRRLLLIGDDFRFDWRHPQFNLSTCGKILWYGFPCALNNCLYSISTLQIQSAINSYGEAAVAGNSAAIGIEGFAASFNGGIGTSCLTFLGQNLGAGKRKRVFRTVRYSLFLEWGVAAVLSTVIYASRRFLLGLYVPGDEAAIAYGCIRLDYLIRFYIISATNGVLVSSIQAFGYPLFTFADNILSALLFRVIWMQYVYPRVHTFDNLMLCFLVSWSIICVSMSVILIILLIRYRNGHEKTL